MFGHSIKISTVGSLDCDVCPHFLRANQNFGLKWRHNSDVVSGFELCQIIAIGLKFYEFCLHHAKLSPSPISTALNVEEDHFSQLSCSWRNLTKLWLCFLHRNKIGASKSRSSSGFDSLHLLRHLSFGRVSPSRVSVPHRDLASPIEI